MNVVDATRNYTEVAIDDYIADLFLEFKIKVLRLTNDFILTGLSKIKMRYPIDNKILKEYLQKKKRISLSDKVMSLRMPQGFITENENQTVQNVSDSNLTLEKQKRNTLLSSVLLGVLIACLKFNGVEEVKLVLTQFSIAKDSVGLVSIVLVAAPLVLLVQPQNDKTRYYNIAVFVIICLLQVFCAAISINQALGTAFEKAITEATPFQKSSFTYWMSPVRPLLELLMELVLLGNLKQR